MTKTAGASFALHDDDDDDEISSPKLRGPSVRTLVGVVPCSVGLLTLFSKQRDGFELRKITSGVLWICVTVADSCLYSKPLCSGLCGLVFRETSPPHPPLLSSLAELSPLPLDHRAGEFHSLFWSAVSAA